MATVPALPVPAGVGSLFAFLARMLGIALLALAVVLAVLDLTRSVAASELVVTSLDASWTAASAGTRAALEGSVRRTAGEGAWSILLFVLAVPGWAVFGALSALLLWLGRRRRSAYSRFARE